MTTTDAVQETREALELDGELLIEEQDGPLVAQPPDSVVYASRRRDLVLVLEPRFPILGQHGGKVGETRGIRAKFRNATLKLDRSNPDHAELIERLEKHRLNGNMFEGFWRSVDPAPAATQQEMQHIVDGAIGMDVELLERFIAEEESGYARQDVLDTARMALARVRKVLEAQAAAPEQPERPAEPPQQ